MIASIVGDPSVDIRKAPLQSYAEKFLRRGGMDTDTLTALKGKLGIAGIS